MKAVTLLSGGLDSTTLLYWLLDHGYTVEYALSFDYGQRHRKELAVAEAIATDLNVRHDTVVLGLDTGKELHPFGDLLPGSSLTDATVKVPDGHYAEESMKATVVPNRNAIMLSIAYAVAVAHGCDLVAFAAHAGDHAIYPDCRPEFVGALARALSDGNEWANPVPAISAPFLDSSKADIALHAAKLHVPIAKTWSCYKGGDIHCGTCGTCYERRQALREVRNYLPDFEDPTLYLDSTTEFKAPEEIS